MVYTCTHAIVLSKKVLRFSLKWQFEFEFWVICGVLCDAISLIRLLKHCSALYLGSFPIVYSLLRFVKRLTIVRDFCRTMDNWMRAADAKVNLHGEGGFVARIVDTMVWRRILQGDHDDVDDGVINLAMIMMMMIMSFSALGVPANVSQGVLKLLQVWRQPAPAGDIWRLRDSFSTWSGFMASSQSDSGLSPQFFANQDLKVISVDT